MLPPGDASSRLGVALSLKFCQLEGHFPRAAQELPLVAVQYIAKQLDVDLALATTYDWQGRTGTRYRRHLRLFLGMRPATVADVKALAAWLRTEIVPGDHDLRHLQAAVVEWCHEHHLEPPYAGRVDRVLRSLVRTHEHEVCTRVAAVLLPATRTALDAFLLPGPGGATEEETAEVLPLIRPTPFHVLKGDPGRVGRGGVWGETVGFCLTAPAGPASSSPSRAPQTRYGFWAVCR